MKLKINIETEEYVTREATESEWDRDDTREEHTILGAEQVTDGCHDFEVTHVKDGDTLYFVYALYNTGDSFGSSENLLCQLALLKHLEDAEYLQELLRKDYQTYREKGNYDYKPLKVTYPKSGFTENIGTGTWKGYFESLNGFEIAPVEVRKANKKPLRRKR
jgi:hypothetical protein